VPAVRQKFHLSSCADFRDQLSRRIRSAPNAAELPSTISRTHNHALGSFPLPYGIQEYARVRARESNVSREMVANCSRPVRLLQLMLMPVQIATRAILTPSPIGRDPITNRFQLLPFHFVRPTLLARSTRRLIALPGDSADHKMAERTQIQLKAATHIFSRNSCIHRARRARL
jgi:hypothetical protein